MHNIGEQENRRKKEIAKTKWSLVQTRRMDALKTPCVNINDESIKADCILMIRSVKWWNMNICILLIPAWEEYVDHMDALVLDGLKKSTLKRLLTHIIVSYISGCTDKSRLPGMGGIRGSHGRFSLGWTQEIYSQESTLHAQYIGTRQCIWSKYKHPQSHRWNCCAGGQQLENERWDVLFCPSSIVS